jgi:hypothetical protein
MKIILRNFVCKISFNYDTSETGFLSFLPSFPSLFVDLWGTLQKGKIVVTELREKYYNLQESSKVNRK